MESARPQDVPDVPHLVIRPSSFWRSFDFRELWQFRDLLLVLGGRDVKLRYRQTALGVIWVILQPLVAAGVFAFVFGKVARLPSGGVPYFLLAYAGFLAWSAFQSTFAKTSLSLVQNTQLVSKVFFPRLVLPLSTVLSTLLDFAVGLALLLVLLPFYGLQPGPEILLIPVWLVLLQLLALGLGLYASALVVSYRDVQHALPVLAQLLLYASPIAYPAAAVPERLRDIYLLNPLAGLIEAFRWSVLGRGNVDWSSVAYAGVCSVLVFLAGALAFRSMEKKFADVI
jgi:lipopolysaccharide transport system permease protein